MDLFNVKTTDEMLLLMHEHFAGYPIDTEKINFMEGVGRVLAEDIVSEVDVPHFNRSVVDGYAVMLSDVRGASESIPAFLKIIGSAQMGEATNLHLSSGETIYVPTGGMVPQGTEAMVMMEYTEKFGEDELALYKGAGSLENMMCIGDDVKKGKRVFSRGHRLRPQDIGVLTSIGQLTPRVYCKPRVTIISTGDEILKPGSLPNVGEIVDINTPALAVLSQSYGVQVSDMIYAKDEGASISAAIKLGITKSDFVVLSGGSSVGEKDFTLRVLQGMGNVFLQGLSVKPGKPTIMAVVEGKAVIGLPGQPASALMVYLMVLKNLMNIYHQGCLYPNAYIVGELAQNIHAAPGRKTFQTVKVKQTEKGVVVEPTYGKSGMITLLSESDGYLEIAENEEGKEKGEIVKVTLF